MRKPKIVTFRGHMGSGKSTAFANLKLFPSNKDESDIIGIAQDKFWFSFNADYAISKFETDATAGAIEKHELSKNVSIEYLE